MRLALVQDFLRLGGTETQTVALANAFAEAGHEVLLVTFRPGGPLAGDVADNVHHITLQRRDRRLDWHAPGLIEVLRVFRPDVVQLMGRMANCHGWRIVKKLPSTKVVATFRTGKSIPWFFRKTLNAAHAVVSNSEEAAGRVVQKTDVLREQITVIHNAIARTDPPSQSRKSTRRKIGTTPEAAVFLCVAMMRPGKGHKQLIQAFARAQTTTPSELWLAGDGTERAAAEETARSFDVADRVRFLGRRNDSTDLYAAADVAVLASRVESLPNFLVEAQWHGLPVIALDTAGVQETFIPVKTGELIDSMDTDKFPKAMARLADNADLRRTMGDAARANARDKFDAERQNERYLELYEKLMLTG